ncbi:H-NS family nucleoid-associated regulatory protein [Xenophilus azovorans]|uniref:H-NS histone family protein n=1 Tax=Xenophilus azovorans TaxID=151755 RepID=UPI000570A46B|nr:H-NS histone family protein [Xenophilus azovorans]
MARNKLTLKEIDAEIAKLQQQANEIRESEKAGVIARMKDAVAYYGITASDLGLGSGARTGTKAVKADTVAETAGKTKRGAGRIKFKDGAGNSWSGFGPKPKWFTEALASGKTADELRAA